MSCNGMNYSTLKRSHLAALQKTGDLEFKESKRSTPPSAIKGENLAS